MYLRIVFYSVCTLFAILMMRKPIIAAVPTAILYDADFSNEGDGFPDHSTGSPPASAPQTTPLQGTSPNQWTLAYTATPSTDGTDNEFSVNSGVLRIQDWGNQNANFTSQTIDVSGATIVDITAVGQTIGASVQDAGSEFFEYFYILDGGTPQSTSITLSGDTSGTAVNYSITNLDVSSANTLQVGFNFRVNGSNEGYEIASFVVESTGTDTVSPIIDTLNPADDNLGVPVATNLIVTFDENIQLTGFGTIMIIDDTDGSSTTTISLPDARVIASGMDVTIDLSIDLDSETAYHIMISNDAVEDTAGNAFAGITNAASWNFTTANVTVGISDEAHQNTIAGRSAAASLDDSWAAGFGSGVFSIDLFSNATSGDVTGSKSFADATAQPYQIDWQLGIINDSGPGLPTSQSFSAITSASPDATTISASDSLQGVAPNPFASINRLSTNLNSVDAVAVGDASDGLNALRLDFTNSSTPIRNIGFFIGDTVSRPDNGTVARVLVFDPAGELLLDQPLVFTGNVLNAGDAPSPYTVSEGTSRAPSGPANNDNSTGYWGNETTVFISVRSGIVGQNIGSIILHVGDDDHTSSNDGTTEQFAVTGFQLPENGPNAVVLAEFNAIASTDSTVMISWSTEAEWDHAGFNIYRRAENSRGDWALVNNELIASRGTQAQGADYTHLEYAVPAGNWEYLLEDVETDGDTYRHFEHVATTTVQIPTAVVFVNNVVAVESSAGLLLFSFFITIITIVVVRIWPREN